MTIMSNTGIVKWFNNVKGFGFIEPDSGDADIFVHYSEVQSDGYKTLSRGQTVKFEVRDGPKGLQALNVVAGEPVAGRSVKSADAEAEYVEAEELEAEQTEAEPA